MSALAAAALFERRPERLGGIPSDGAQANRSLRRGAARAGAATAARSSSRTRRTGADAGCLRAANVFPWADLDDLDFPVRLVNVGQSASDGEKYANKKAEFFWGLRMRFQAGDVAGLTRERTISQLAGIVYEHDARGGLPSSARRTRASGA
ncbi:MAG TPA: hypothetical protein VL049_17340 [Candidatus Dormibacteraeota bacterium]|nr:hypothetical protein [Candidatus Dormibacteraeota bacterium]